MKNTLSVIYKREMKLLFCSLSGWIFIALNTAALGICSVWLCLRNGNPSFQYVPETASLLLCFTVPLLQAMTVGSEWKRGETGMLLRYASPFSVTMGKYLAEVTVFAVPAVICAVLPFVMTLFGANSLAISFSSALTYALIGLAILALGLFVSTLIKHPVISGVVSVAVCLLLNVASNVAKIVTASQSAPFVLGAILLTALVTAIMLVYLNNAVIPVVFVATCSVATLIVTLAGGASTVLRTLMKLVSPQYAFYENIYGTLSLHGLIQPLLFTAVFVVFTVLNHANYNKRLSVGGSSEPENAGKDGE